MTTIDIHYQKRKNLDLFKTLESKDLLYLSNTQNYIPIYNRFFSLNDTNFNNINLNNKRFIKSVKYNLKEHNNLFKCTIKNIDNEDVKEKDIFIKLAPLIDPFKYLVGKYNLNDNKLFKLPNLIKNNETLSHSKLLDMNNSAYIDGFFIYLISSLKENYKFEHGLDYYGSFLSIKNNFKLNVFDDLEYLTNSDFFIKNKNVLFKVDDYEHLVNANKYDDDKPQLKPIKIHNSEKNKFNLSIKSINDDIYENIFLSDDKSRDYKNFHENETLEQITFNINERLLNDEKTTTIKTNSTCSSRTSHTNSENNDEYLYDETKDCDICEEECKDCDDSNGSWEDIHSGQNSEDDISEEEEEILATIPKLPVEVICMENCEDTFDNLIMNNDLSNDEWFAYLMQIIMILLTYQNTFLFTHNDLHTNNVMYNKTNKKYITYHFNNNIYKVPTYGKLFKIIDFGRSIYKFQGKVFCSDSFKNGNDAAGQYNTEPYFNENKPRIEPNFSFDLCRLACSIFDYVIEVEELKNKPTFFDEPVKNLLFEWCLDDNGTNVLYKNNGDERYPDFKLYKMIARHVHKHTPLLQLERPEFKQFLVNNNNLEKNLNNNIIIDIDRIPSMY
jgi:hypothetical protein